MTASSLALQAFRRAYFDPANAHQTQSRADYARLLWAYYSNDVFEDVAKWSTYRSAYRLYRQTRSIYNPVRRLADFYAGQTYPGVLSIDGSRLPEGVQIAIPLADDTPQPLKVAIAQTWRWSNWQSGKSVMVRYGAVAGSVMVEVVDDVARGKVTYNVVWPALVTELELDSAGNVKSYSIEYNVQPEGQKAYQYRKTVDRQAFRYFRDDKPYDYGEGAAVPNPYGFVPAVWIKHRDLGGTWGAPAIHGSLGKIDELNSLASHIHDQVHKVVAAPVVVFGGGNLRNLLGTNTAKRGATEDVLPADEDRESMLILGGPEGGSIGSLAGSLNLKDALLYIQELIGEIEQDYPELAMYRQLREMTQISGVAASRLMGDAGAMVFEAQANYDNASVKLFQMAVAIGGWRLANGWWPNPTRQQQLFKTYDLDSYARGELDFDIMPRPLVAPTAAEEIEAERSRLGLEADRAAGSVAADLEARLLAGNEPTEE